MASLASRFTAAIAAGKATEATFRLGFSLALGVSWVGSLKTEEKTERKRGQSGQIPFGGFARDCLVNSAVGFPAGSNTVNRSVVDAAALVVVDVVGHIQPRIADGAFGFCLWCSLTFRCYLFWWPRFCWRV